jgi:hypothetical protein
MKPKELYRSKLHVRDKSYDMSIVEWSSGQQSVKLKMTYECYNALERFTGELWVGGKWEHTFTLMDLNEEVEKSMYIHDNQKRIDRAEKLFKKGTELFNIINF